MDIGRRQNADPRWILPLLCRRGHITRSEIGAIRIGPNETHFQVPRAASDKFAAALDRTASAAAEDGGDVLIERSPHAPRETARQNRKASGPARRSGPPHSASDKPREDRPHRNTKGPKKVWSKKSGPKKPGNGRKPD
jgi:ATP-dependent RNA helicase DeaD